MKEIVISKNSIWANLYRFIYFKELPKTLCTFFWANLLGIMLLIPYIIILLPTIIKDLSNSKKERSNFLDNWVRTYRGEFPELLFVSFVRWTVILIVLSYMLSVCSMIKTGTLFIKNSSIFWLVNVGLIVFSIGYFYSMKFKPRLEKKRLSKLLLTAKEAYIKKNNKQPQLSDLVLLHWYKEIYLKEEEKDTHWIVVILNAIKGFYNKNCPIITWK